MHVPFKNETNKKFVGRQRIVAETAGRVKNGKRERAAAKNLIKVFVLLSTLVRVELA